MKTWKDVLRSGSHIIAKWNEANTLYKQVKNEYDDLIQSAAESASPFKVGDIVTHTKLFISTFEVKRIEGFLRDDVLRVFIIGEVYPPFSHHSLEQILFHGTAEELETYNPLILKELV